MVKAYITGRFYAWGEDGLTPITFSFNGNWFAEAINCRRDGDMGDMDEDGVFSRHWYSDSIFLDEIDDVKCFRYATPAEVRLYTQKCPNWARNASRYGDARYRGKGNGYFNISLDPVSITQTPLYTEAVFEVLL